MADDFEGRRAETIHLVREARTGRSFRVRFEAEPPPHLRTGARVTVRGRAAESTIHVAASGGEGITLQSSAGTAASVGHGTLVMLANFRDAAVTCSVQSITDMVFTDPNGKSSAALYNDCSLGAVQLNGQVTGPYSLDASSADPCDFNTWAQAIDAQASAAGVDVASYQHKVYVFPPSQCVAAGYATVGGMPSSAWIFQCGVRGLYAHELGHNLGLEHASTPTSEYDDFTDPMAMSTGMLPGVNAPHRAQLGWHGASSMQPIDQSGTYEVAPLALQPGAATAPQILKISKPDTGDFYYLSYRLPIGYDAAIDGSFFERLSVHRYKGDGSPARTFRLAGLADGERFTDTTNGVTVTMLSHTSTHATVSIEITPAPEPPPVQGPSEPAADTAAPSAPTGLTASVSQKQKQVQLTWSPAADNVAVAGYRIWRDGAAVATTAGTAWSEAIRVGEVRTYAVEAYDAAGNRSPLSASITVSTRKR